MSHPASAISANTRRDFLKQATTILAAGAVLGQSSDVQAAQGFGDKTIRVGLVGCGGRGLGAIDQILGTDGPTQLVAVCDAFDDAIDRCLTQLRRSHDSKIAVSAENRHAGFDGFRKVLEADIDLVVLATPPGFRPQHFEAAVDANKHVFMEKPVAVDAPGVRRILAANRKAKDRQLAVAVGLQRHHEPQYIETIRQIHEGMLGDIVLGRVYWNMGGLWIRERQPTQTELEYQMRNWYYFNWLCGDHIVEQHIHNIDVFNWALNDYPISAQGQGGRQVRTGPDHGQIFDHHFVEFTYASGAKMFSQCRQIDHCWNSVSEHAHGTLGTADIGGGVIHDLRGKLKWKYEGPNANGHLQEQINLIASLRHGEIPNEGDFGAMSTMSAILGRMATYSGQLITMQDALVSTLSLADIDAIRDFNDQPPVMPDKDGRYPVALPGLTPALTSPKPEEQAQKGPSGSESTGSSTFRP